MCAMRILSSMRKQNAVLWNTPVPDGFGGFTYDAAVQIKVRWEDTQEKFFTPAGEEKISRSLVYTGQDVAVGAMLALGTKAEVSPDSSGGLSGDPTDSAILAWPVLGFGKLPTLKADGYLRTCFL